MKAVQITRWGDIHDLEVAEVPTPEPGPGEVRVRVGAAGLNPVDWKIVEILKDAPGSYADGLVLPAGNGNDFAGVVDAVGADVTAFAVGDEVLGGKRFFAQAEYVVATPEQLLPLPEGLSIAQGAGLWIVGLTAVASVNHVGPQPGETVLVSAAAGGVGVLAAQLAKARGARVLGTASPANHDYLRSLGIEPLAYGEGLVERLRAAAPEGIDAVLDNEGEATLRAAAELGVPLARTNTIAAHAYAAAHGITTKGAAEATAAQLAELAERIAKGEIDFPIEASYPLDEVVAAYDHLKAGHLRGKIVLVP